MRINPVKTYSKTKTNKGGSFMNHPQLLVAHEMSYDGFIYKFTNVSFRLVLKKRTKNAN